MQALCLKQLHKQLQLNTSNNNESIGTKVYSLGIINNNVYVTCHYVFYVKNFGLKSLHSLISNYLYIHVNLN